MRYLGPDDLRAALPMTAAIEAMREAFGDDRETPPRALVGPSLFMPGRVGDVSGIKVVSTEPGNPVGIVAVFDARGTPLGLCHGPTLTALRTGAASGLATDLMARPDSRAMAMLGAGAMALDQVEAVRTIDRVLVWSRNMDHAEALAERAGGSTVTDPGEAVGPADIISTATPATSPPFPAGAARRGTHVNAIGTFAPAMRELPAALLRESFVVVDDHKAAARSRRSTPGGSGAGRHYGTMADLLRGRITPPPATTTVFKSVGIASQDVAAAAAADRAAPLLTESLATAGERGGAHTGRVAHRLVQSPSTAASNESIRFVRLIRRGVGVVATDRASPRDVGWASMGRTIRRTALFAARPVARRVMTGVLVGLPLPIESALRARRGRERARKSASWREAVSAIIPGQALFRLFRESRVLDWGSRGRRFKSGQPDQRNPCLGEVFARFRVELDHGAGAGVLHAWSTRGALRFREGGTRPRRP